jgi:hypothetical protein
VSVGAPTASAWVPVPSVSLLRRRVEQLHSRAQRLNLTPPRLLVTPDRRTQRGTRQVRVELYGDLPALAGWRLIAELRHREDRPTEVKRLLDAAGLDLSRWQRAEPRCEHCGLARARRRTYLLRHASGDIAQVGSGCLADFTGHSDPGSVLTVSRAFAEPTPTSGRSPESGVASDPTLRDYLAAVCVVGRSGGFVGARANPEGATAVRATELLERGDPPIDDRAREEAAEIEAWVLHVLARRRDLRDFDRRLVSVFQRSERVSPRARATVAAAWPAHRRAAAIAGRRHLGDVGDTIEIEVRVRMTKPTRQSSSANPMVFCDLRDLDGHRVSLFTTSPLEVGCHYRLRVTIDRHDHFGGHAVTVVGDHRVLESRGRDAAGAAA